MTLTLQLSFPICRYHGTNLSEHLINLAWEYLSFIFHFILWWAIYIQIKVSLLDLGGSEAKIPQGHQKSFLRYYLSVSSVP